MQDPPRGGYYPVGTTQQLRQYQFNASNPWQREEREKVNAFCFMQNNGLLLYLIKLKFSILIIKLREF